MNFSIFTILTNNISNLGVDTSNNAITFETYIQDAAYPFRQNNRNNTSNNVNNANHANNTNNNANNTNNDAL